MSETDTTVAIRRILVALDASPDSLAALDAAVDFAARMGADLVGLFVEDTGLLRIAESPSAREIAHTAASAGPLNRDLMERNLRGQSEHIRKALAAAAQRAQVRWSFQTVRGEVASALRAAVARDDVVAIGRQGWSFGHRFRIGSTALEFATSSIPLLLISQHPVPAGTRTLVHYDGSPASANALRITAKLAMTGAKRITVLVSGTDYEAKRAEIQNLLEGHGLEVRCRRIDMDERIGLLDAAREERAGMLVLAGRQVLKDRQTLETLLREIQIPVLLLGDGFGAEDTAAKYATR